MATNTADSLGKASQPAPSAGDFIDEMFRAHAVSLVRAAVLLLGDQPSAEDVVQDAFLRLYRGLAGLRDRDKALRYLRASVINGARSVLRAFDLATGRTSLVRSLPGRRARRPGTRPARGLPVIAAWGPSGSGGWRGAHRPRPRPAARRGSSSRARRDGRTGRAAPG
jgi:Sigma-70 region 2